MTTHSFVGRVESDGSFTARTVTYDGYPAGVGAALAALLAQPWAQRSPARVLAELAAYPHWWSIGPDQNTDNRAGLPDRSPHEQTVPLAVGRVGATYVGQQQWGYLFHGEQELVVVKIGPWWTTPPYAVQRWATIPVDALDDVDWDRLACTGERAW